ncbi:MAG: YitT family protein [Roseburia sp.]|nr:YitT family protein [Roseburia sp.]
MLNKTEKLQLTKKYAMIAVGCIVYSLGVALFLDINALASGGVTGIAIMINYLSGGRIGTGWLIIIINVPLFILGGVFFGKRFIVSTLISTALSSGLIELWAYTVVPYMPTIDNILISAVVGGMLFGAGLGLIFRAGSTTGGTDIVVKLLRKKFRHLRSGIISGTIDCVILAASAFVYKDIDLLFYTALSVLMFTAMFDWVLYGGNSAKLVHIVTTADKAAPICDGILKELDISATLVEGKGAYTSEERTIIMCVVKNTLYPKLRDIIHAADPRAFTIVSSAKEIYGEGYKASSEEEL